MNRKTAETKARELLSRMTLQEKTAQVSFTMYGFDMYERNGNGEIIVSEAFRKYVKENGVPGIVSNYFRADPWSKKLYGSGGITISEREHAYNVLQRFIVMNSPNHIPALFGEDDPHGRQVLDSVMYPVGLNVGCSWNPECYRRESELIGEECALGGVHLSYLTLLDLGLDPRWGRFEECFSEDPCLTASFASSAVRGIREKGTLCCAKHLAAQGAVLGGHNGGNTDIGESELREIHLPAAEAAVRSGTDFFMVAYNDIDGIPCHCNGHLLNDILRDEYGFDGVMFSDACAVDNLVSLTDDDLAKAGALALRNGLDVGHGDQAMTLLSEAVNKGELEEEELNRSVLRLLIRKFECGLMENPFLPENGQSGRFLESGKSREAAYEMAKESLVLLKNQDGLLPLKSRKILLIGGNAADIYYMTGDYSSERKNPFTLKDAVINNGGSYLEGWTFEKGITCSETELGESVNAADVVLMTLGGSSARDFESCYNRFGYIEKKTEKYIDCGEGTDLASLELPPFEKEMMKRVSRYGKPIVSVLLMGRPYALTEAERMSDAILFAGYPGDLGAAAILDALYGKTNDFGKLSFTYPKSVGQLPLHYNQRSYRDYVDMDDRPLYPFGHGLSYSAFGYSSLSVLPKSREELEKGEKIQARFLLHNVSDRDGKEVAQLYIHRFGGTRIPRLRELKGFWKVFLKAGEQKEIVFLLGKDDLEEFTSSGNYRLNGMTLTLMVGSSSEDLWLRESIKIN